MRQVSPLVCGYVVKAALVCVCCGEGGCWAVTLQQPLSTPLVSGCLTRMASNLHMRVGEKGRAVLVEIVGTRGQQLGCGFCGKHRHGMSVPLWRKGWFRGGRGGSMGHLSPLSATPVSGPIRAGAAHTQEWVGWVGGGS